MYQLEHKIARSEYVNAVYLLFYHLQVLCISTSQISVIEIRVEAVFVNPISKYTCMYIL